LNVKFEHERKKTKESYERLIDELKNETKLLYENLNEELNKKDDYLR